MDTEFYSIKEIAVIFGVNEKTIRRAIKKRLLPFIRIGNGPRSPYRISKLVIGEIHDRFLKGLQGLR
jgi:excisionase family DNA binding protein